MYFATLELFLHPVLPFFVIPAKAGIQGGIILGSRFRGNDRQNITEFKIIKCNIRIFILTNHCEYDEIKLIISGAAQGMIRKGETGDVSIQLPFLNIHKTGVLRLWGDRNLMEGTLASRRSG
jgi:hypothetical protein